MAMALKTMMVTLTMITTTMTMRITTTMKKNHDNDNDDNERLVRQISLLIFSQLISFSLWYSQTYSSSTRMFDILIVSHRIYKTNVLPPNS